MHGIENGEAEGACRDEEKCKMSGRVIGIGQRVRIFHKFLFLSYDWEITSFSNIAHILFYSINS